MKRLQRVAYLVAGLMVAGATSILPTSAAPKHQAESSCGPNRTITRVSVMGDGTEYLADSTSFGNVMLSADGTVAAYYTLAALLPEDTNGVADVYVYDLNTHELSLASVASDGTVAEGGDSRLQDMSADGRYIAFVSEANNLVPDDETWQDLFVHDRATGETVKVSADGVTISAEMSADGQVIAYVTIGAEVVEGDTNGVEDIFVYDRTTGETTRISVGPDGTEGNDKANFAHLSADGQMVAFDTKATNLVAGETWDQGGIFVVDRATGETKLVTDFAAAQSSPTYLEGVSPDGQSVIFTSFADGIPEDTNLKLDVYRYDVATGAITVLPAPTDVALAVEYTPSDMAASGAQAVFKAGDGQAGVANDNNGLYDAFLFDSITMKIIPLSVNAAGEWADAGVTAIGIADDGCAAIFTTAASNLVEGDTNGFEDAFVVRFTE